ncbi:MAG: A/G-specific adenine glycosylase [Acholeplasmataceae bacterium]
MDVHALNAWYESNKRDLAFRKTQDPYHIWVSEIMLQQTQVDTVIPYFLKFIKKYPTVLALAQTPLEVLLKDVEGLGYYRRFKLMLKAAIMIKDQYQGIFPNTYKDVLALPGVGHYTAGAIMSIAYKEPYSAVDGNVIRVLSRYFALGDDMRQEKHRKKIQDINQTIIVKTKPHIYTQALMELGAIICKPKDPKCDLCPLNTHCLAHLNHTEEAYPVLSKLSQKVEKSYITFIITDGNNLILNKREEQLLEGMYEYPQVESESLYDALNQFEADGIAIEPMGNPMTYKHVFTHQIWLMTVYHARHIAGMRNSWQTLSADEVASKPMAIAHKKIKKTMN